MKHLSLKLITVMKYLGTDGEYHFVMVDDIMFPSLEDRLNYLSQLGYKLWANGEIVEHIWTRKSAEVVDIIWLWKPSKQLRLAFFIKLLIKYMP